MAKNCLQEKNDEGYRVSMPSNSPESDSLPSGETQTKVVVNTTKPTHMT